MGLEYREEMNDVYRLGDGSHLSLSLSNLKIMQSYDEGLSWSALNTPIYSLSFFVTENDEIIAFNQSKGFSMYKSKDYGETYEWVFSDQTEYHTTPMKNIFTKFDAGYYFVAR